MRKEEVVEIDGLQIKVATIRVEELETIELAGLTGRKFNIAFIKCSLLAAGDKEHAADGWIRGLPAFGEQGENGEPDIPSDFDRLLAATNKVNGFKPKPAVVKPGEGAPAEPAA